MLYQSIENPMNKSDAKFVTSRKDYSNLFLTFFIPT